MPIQLAMPIAHVMFQSFMCHEIALIVAVPMSCSCHSYGGVCGKRQLHAHLHLWSDYRIHVLGSRRFSDASLRTDEDW